MLVLLALPVCASCLTSSSQYLDDFRAYAVARGTILKVENLTMDGAMHLRDGFAVPITVPGCRVTIDFDRETQTVDMHPGGVLVFSTNEDLLILPLTPNQGETAPQEGGETKQSEQGDTQTAEAPKADPKKKESKEELAKKAYNEATSLVAKNQHEAARQAFERAYALNAKDPAVTKGLLDLLKKMGLELYSKGKLEQAVTHWERALELRPKDEETLRYLKRAETVSKRL
jgi:tetratricopeptide (TPR) repeat protein